MKPIYKLSAVVIAAGMMFASCGSEEGGDEEKTSTEGSGNEQVEGSTADEITVESISIDMPTTKGISPADFFKNAGIVLGNNLNNNLGSKGMMAVVNKDKIIEGWNDHLVGNTPDDLQPYGEKAAAFVRSMDSGEQSAAADIPEASYAIGVLEADNLKSIMSSFEVGDQIDAEQVTSTFKQMLTGGMNQADIDSANAKVETYLVELQKTSNQLRQERAAEFLSMNKERKGVKETASGLQYMVLETGDGPKPAATDKVRVHYHGTTLDGTVFDSSVDRGQPAEFGVGQVISGWTEALQMMPVGAKYKLWVPQDLAYGANPRPGGPIKPFQMLIFEVELIDIVKE